LVQAYRHRAQFRIRTHYDWENVVDQYERLFARLSGKALAEPEKEPATDAPSTSEVSTR
jgi:hypothetical protein